MLPRSPTPGLLLLALGGGWAALLHLDRSSPLALAAVEIDAAAPLRLAPALALVGAGLLAAWGFGRASAARAPSRAAAGPARVGSSAASGDLRSRAAALPLPGGCRLLVDDPPTVPLHLRVEGAPEGRVRRALADVGAFLASVPRPTRLKVSFKDCPAPTSPWHHQVAAALSAHLPPAEFRVVAQADGVDVLFHHPDPAWRR
jgi:hypothetical protein